jgi:hypothetical protein
VFKVQGGGFRVLRVACLAMILSTISSLEVANAAALQLPIARLRRITLAGCDSANKAWFGSFAIQSTVTA